MKIDEYKRQLDILQDIAVRIAKLKALIEKTDEYNFNISCGFIDFTVAGVRMKEKLEKFLGVEVKKYKRHLEEFNKMKLESEWEDL